MGAGHEPLLAGEIDDHITVALARQADPGAMMVKALGEQAWPDGDVDLPGHLF